MTNIKNILLAIAVAVVVCGCTTFNGSVIPTDAQTLKSKFIKGEFKASNGVVMQVRTYLPEMTTPRKFPLLVYLHGAGQNGDDNTSQLDDSVGCLYSFTFDREEYKAVIVVPQCPAGVYWRNEEMLEALKELVEYYVDNPAIDEDRIYITGFSMGGDASWKLALAYPDLMSTIVPVCGGPLASMEPDIPDVPDEMADLNIWAFNNFNDGVVRPNYSKRIFAKLWDLSDGDHLNFTEYLEGSHNAKQVYKDRNILIWMLSTKRR